MPREEGLSFLCVEVFSAQEIDRVSFPCFSLLVRNGVGLFFREREKNPLDCLIPNIVNINSYCRRCQKNYITVRANLRIKPLIIL